MTRPRPWHRSRLFWLGIPGLLFLLWAWFLFGSTLNLSWGNPNTVLRIQYQPGVLCLIRTTIDRTQLGENQFSFGAHILGFQKQIKPIAPAERKHFAWRLEWIDDVNTLDPVLKSSVLTLPLWFLTSLYLTAWLTTLHLWQRRKHRLLEKATTTPSP